jgi:hypothetical protein
MWYVFFTAVGSFRIPVWPPEFYRNRRHRRLPTFNYVWDTLSGQRFYEIRESTRTIGEYPSLGNASREWLHAPSGKKVVEVDVYGHVVQVFSAEECRKSAKNPLDQNSAQTGK